jgi:ABC-2 type transport system ATP-binding protein
VSSVTTQPEGAVRVELHEEGATTVVLRRLVDAGVTDVKTSLPSLEEVYIQVIGERGLEL